MKTLSFAEALKHALTHWSFCRKRVRRSEFWWCMLACAIYVGALIGLQHLLENIVHLNLSTTLGGIISLVLCLPPIGLMAQQMYGRLHDVNRRDTWLVGVIAPLVALVAICATLEPEQDFCQLPIGYSLAIGALLTALFVATVCCLVFFLQDSDKGENDYGPSPKYQQSRNTSTP